MKPTQAQLAALGRLAVDTRPAELTCDELLPLVPRYAELMAAGEPIPVELQPVVEHLRLCPECSEELATLREALAGDDSG